MRILSRSLRAVLSVITIAFFASTAEAQERLYWSAGGWKVFSSPSAPGGAVCMAGRDFTNTQNGIQRAGWGLAQTVDGRWGLLISVSGAHGMAGRRATISVDGQIIHSAIAPNHTTQGAHLWILPGAAVRPIANGNWMTIEGPFRTLRFRLAGLGSALGVLHRCAQELRVAGRVPPAASPPPAARKAPESGGSSGTGFYVSTTGLILTNAHVVRRCSAIHVRGDSGIVEQAVFKGADDAYDLALLQVPTPPQSARSMLSWGEDAPLGSQIAVFGYPYFGTYTEAGTFTRGDVTALAGLAGNTAHFQISAPIQPGNSGGPVSNEQGHVVGVVVSRLSSSHAVRHTGELPQNVNFAIKSAHARSFLRAHWIFSTTADPREPQLTGPELAARLKAVTVVVVCRRG